jgi:hypothetical protein
LPLHTNKKIYQKKKTYSNPPAVKTAISKDEQGVDIERQSPVPELLI